jgi:putative component of toxin-antitoxin plasmid stabilization module
MKYFALYVNRLCAVWFGVVNAIADQIKERHQLFGRGAALFYTTARLVLLLLLRCGALAPAVCVR